MVLLDAATQRSVIGPNRILERRRTSSAVEGMFELIDRRDQARVQGPVGARRGASERSREAGSIGGERRGSVCVREGPRALWTTCYAMERGGVEGGVGSRAENKDSRARRRRPPPSIAPKAKGAVSNRRIRLRPLHQLQDRRSRSAHCLLSHSQSNANYNWLLISSSFSSPLVPSCCRPPGADSRVGLLQVTQPRPSQGVLSSLDTLPVARFSRHVALPRDKVRLRSPARCDARSDRNGSQPAEAG